MDSLIFFLQVRVQVDLFVQRLIRYSLGWLENELVLPRARWTPLLVPQLFTALRLCSIWPLLVLLLLLLLLLPTLLLLLRASDRLCCFTAPCHLLLSTLTRQVIFKETVVKRVPQRST